jgi:hypothetical protein
VLLLLYGNRGSGRLVLISTEAGLRSSVFTRCGGGGKRNRVSRIGQHSKPRHMIVCHLPHRISMLMLVRVCGPLTEHN